MLRTKIVCTIGPASRDLDKLIKLAQAGMDVARLNMSHGDHAYHAETIRLVRQAEAQVGKAMAILADLQGPKLRVGQMPADGILLSEGQRVVLTAAADASGQGEIRADGVAVVPVQFKTLPQAVDRDYRILLDDGLLELVVEDLDESSVTCRVQTGGVLTSNKGINLPKADLSIPAITDKDWEDLAFALENQVDWIALSFVRQPEDVVELKRVILNSSPFGRATPVIAKIEKPEAVENIDQIIAVVDGIMVARGDLGIETSPEAVPMMQKMIISKCNQAGVPVITATQMLDSMIRNPRPTRAEASDVANAILDGTDAIMLSGETAVGKYPVQSVLTMARIARQVEQGLGVGLSRPPMGRISISRAVCHAAVDTVQTLGASAIIAPTIGGNTARMLSQFRPPCPIIAITPSPTVQHQLALFWGVRPLLSRRSMSTDEVISDAVKLSWEAGLVHEGEIVVITAGAAGSMAGMTDLIKVHRLPYILARGQGIGTQPVPGRVRRLEGPLSPDTRVDYDEIVVTNGTDRTFVEPLRGVAGLISREGGDRCHSVRLAIELGLPAVTGVDTLDKLVEGQWVILHPELGVVVERVDFEPI